MWFNVRVGTEYVTSVSITDGQVTRVGLEPTVSGEYLSMNRKMAEMVAEYVGGVVGQVAPIQ
jgi:hypothetical protein